MSLYKTCDVKLYNTCYVCFITYVMLFYKTRVMSCLLYNMSCYVIIVSCYVI